MCTRVYPLIPPSLPPSLLPPQNKEKEEEDSETDRHPLGSAMTSFAFYLEARFGGREGGRGDVQAQEMVEDVKTFLSLLFCALTRLGVPLRRRQQQQQWQSKEEEEEKGTDGGGEEAVVRCVFAVIQPWVLMVCGRARRRTRDGWRNAWPVLGSLQEEEVVAR